MKLNNVEENKNLIAHYNYEELQTEEDLIIIRPLTEEEIKNLKYLNLQNTLNFYERNYQSLNQVTKELKRLGKNNKLVTKINDKDKFNKYLIKNNINYDNLYISTTQGEYQIKDYLKLEKILYEMISDIDHLSPFEKYIYAYNVTKKYKKYKNNKENKKEAGNLYDILFNEYMACVGFYEMFANLLNKLQINSIKMSVTVDTSYDEIKLNQENIQDTKVADFSKHARIYSYIKDDKYGIDGFFIGDPTWDNNLERDYYNHLALTTEESLKSKRYLLNKFDDVNELFYIRNLEEYTQKLNILTNNKSQEDKSNNTKQILHDLIKYRINTLDPYYVNKLKEKYNYINLLPNKWPDNITDLTYEIGKYLLNKTNKEIPGETIIEAITNVYKNAYNYKEEDLANKINEIIKYNKKRQELVFPTRYAIKTDGTKEIIMNETNKFDIKMVNKK